MKTYRLNMNYYHLRLNVHDKINKNGKNYQTVKLFYMNEYMFSTCLGIDHFLDIFEEKIFHFITKGFNNSEILEIGKWIEEILNPLEIKRRKKIEKILKNINNENL